MPSIALKALVPWMLAAALAGCAATPPAPAPQPALTSLAGGWQVGSRQMRDSEGKPFDVCTLQRGVEGEPQFWLAATAASLTHDLYLGLRSAELPATADRAARQAVVTIDGTAFRPGRAQQSGDALSMVVPAAQAEAFLAAFAKGYALVVTADDLPGFSLPVDLRGSANGRREWQKCRDGLAAGPNG